MAFPPARFITFEGLDGSGKSTHLKRAAAWLEEEGLPVLVTKEPGGTPLGEELRSLFLGDRVRVADGIVELLLVFASRRQHLVEVIDPALSAGKIVLCDRFTDSTIAYQGFGRGVSLEAIRAVERVATSSRKPDRTLLFDLPAESARGRGHSERRRANDSINRLDAETVDFYSRIREGYRFLLAEDPKRFHVIDSSGDKDRTAEQVKGALADLVLEPSARGRR